MHVLQYLLWEFEINSSPFLISMQLVLREVFQILRHLWVVCRLSQNALEESVNHLGVLHSLSGLKYVRDEENVKECFLCYSEFYKSTWIQNGLFTFLIHVPGRYYGVQRLTTPKALSPKSLSFSFKHTATGVFLRDSLHKKEAKCHNGVNCCLKLINQITWLYLLILAAKSCAPF